MRITKVALFFLTLFFILFSHLQRSSYKNQHYQKSKLNQYFKNVIANNNMAVSNKQLIIDSLSLIRKNSSKVNFVEISEFTDSLSVRWIVSSKKIYHNFVKVNSKESKHISTTYINASESTSMVNFDFKEIISAIEFDLKYKPHSKVKDVLGNYLIKNTKAYALYHIEDNNINDIPFYNSKNAEYNFDVRSVDNQSLHLVKYLLNNYGFEKFHKLWINKFTNFESIYGKNYLKILNEL